MEDTSYLIVHGSVICTHTPYMQALTAHTYTCTYNRVLCNLWSYCVYEECKSQPDLEDTTQDVQFQCILCVYVCVHTCIYAHIYLHNHVCIHIHVHILALCSCMKSWFFSSMSCVWCSSISFLLVSSLCTFSLSLFSSSSFWRSSSSVRATFSRGFTCIDKGCPVIYCV